MVIAVIDGMGGGVGAGLVTRLREVLGDRIEILALGSNALATDRMLKAGADHGASGENAIRVSVSVADIVVAPLGVVIPDSMMGEITSGIAESVIGARGEKLFLPLTQRHFDIVGMETRPLAKIITDAVDAVARRVTPTA